MPKTQEAQSSSTTIFYGVGDNLQTTYTKADQYAIIAEVERRCKQYLDPSFDPASFIYPRDNFALNAEVESLCVFRQSLDSSFSLSLAGVAEAVDSSVDCHALASDNARNDDKKVDSSFSAHNATILKQSAQDSRIFTQNAQNVFSQNATRRQDFGDKNGALQGESRELPKVVMTADSPQQSPFLAPKPTPKPNQAQSAQKNHPPLFTIAIPTYKRVTLLRRAILSALAQDFDKPYEIIVVENPLEPISYPAESMLQEFASRITYYQNAQNIGGLGNWNRCLELASGKWVCLLHSDDELLPSYLSTMHTLAINPAYSQALLIGAIEDASQIYPRTPLQRLYSKCITQARLQKLQMQASFSDGFCDLPPRAMLHNRAKCIEIGGYDESEAPSGDMTFFNRAALCGEVFCYRGDLLTRNHYEASSCKDPNVALMMILQNPQMFLGFSRKLTHAQLVGNHEWWSRYFAHLPLLRLYAQMRLRQQFRLFGVRPSWQERAKWYMREHCYAVFATLKAIKSLLTGRAGTQELESSFENEQETQKVDSSTDLFASVKIMDCHADFQSARNDDKNTDSEEVDSSKTQTFMPPPPLDFLTSQVFVDSRVVNSASAEFVDCHDFARAKSRNDRKLDSTNATTPNELAQDSRILELESAFGVASSQTQLNLDSSKSPSDSKILDEKCGLQGKSQGSYLGGNDCRDFSPLPHFSLKAESPQQKLMPKLAKAS